VNATLTGPTTAVFVRTAREARADPVRALIIPAMPSLLMAVTFTALFDRLGDVIDFPTGSLDEYLVPGLVLFAGLVTGGFTSAQLATDLRTGFIDRLRLHLHGPVPLLLGRFLFETVRVLPSAVIVLAVGLS
jgi:ABC-2 type transport system permease protein